MRPIRATASAALKGARSGQIVSYDAQAAAIEEEFRRQLAGLRRRFRAWEIPGVVRGLQEHRRMSLRLLRERHAVERQPERQARPQGSPAAPRS